MHHSSDGTMHARLMKKEEGTQQPRGRGGGWWVAFGLPARSCRMHVSGSLVGPPSIKLGMGVVIDLQLACTHPLVACCFPKKSWSPSLGPSLWDARSGQQPPGILGHSYMVALRISYVKHGFKSFHSSRIIQVLRMHINN